MAYCEILKGGRSVSEIQQDADQLVENMFVANDRNFYTTNLFVDLPLLGIDTDVSGKLITRYERKPAPLFDSDSGGEKVYWSCEALKKSAGL